MFIFLLCGARADCIDMRHRGGGGGRGGGVRAKKGRDMGRWTRKVKDIWKKSRGGTGREQYKGK